MYLGVGGLALQDEEPEAQVTIKGLGARILAPNSKHPPQALVCNMVRSAQYITSLIYEMFIIRGGGVSNTRANGFHMGGCQNYGAIWAP